ncbi:MAG: hypothetical protein IK118_02865 [Clostridia bacterium]|nr:hypothetical protein [Clostridia bacterium]
MRKVKMKEYYYSIGQKTGRAPVIKKLGALGRGMEQTPVVWKNELYLVESREPDGVCPRQYIRVRKESTGEVSAPFGEEYYFASAFAEGDTLYVFATSRFDDRPLTMYQSEDPDAWHDPRGGHRVRMFRTKDLISWEENDIIEVPARRLWNTSVCRGAEEYVMAIEVSALPGREDPAVGVPFTCFFARSKDLLHWELLPDGCAYTPARYNACPALRYAEGYYYMICLEALPCQRYAPYIYRTKDFELWEVGFHNPIMMWGDDDRRINPGCSLSPEDRALLETGLNINCSDLDLCEYRGKTRIYYANGDQMTYSFLCEAEYDGPLNEFLAAFFR